MRTILLSFQDEWFRQLEIGKMKYEYRKVLPSEETRVFFYVSRPVMAITGIAYFGAREDLREWLNEYGKCSQIVYDRIMEYLKDCRFAAKIYSFQKTNKISIQTMKKEFPRFIPPRMYFYLDNTSILDYLEKNLYPQGKKKEFLFDKILDDICN